MKDQMLGNQSAAMTKKIQEEIEALKFGHAERKAMQDFGKIQYSKILLQLTAY